MTTFYLNPGGETYSAFCTAAEASYVIDKFENFGASKATEKDEKKPLPERPPRIERFIDSKFTGREIRIGRNFFAEIASITNKTPEHPKFMQSMQNPGNCSYTCSSRIITNRIETMLVASGVKPGHIHVEERKNHEGTFQITIPTSDKHHVEAMGYEYKAYEKPTQNQAGSIIDRETKYDDTAFQLKHILEEEGKGIIGPFDIVRALFKTGLLRDFLNTNHWNAKEIMDDFPKSYEKLPLEPRLHGTKPEFSYILPEPEPDSMVSFIMAADFLKKVAVDEERILKASDQGRKFKLEDIEPLNDIADELFSQAVVNAVKNETKIGLQGIALKLSPENESPKQLAGRLQGRFINEVITDSIRDTMQATTYYRPEPDTARLFISKLPNIVQRKLDAVDPNSTDDRDIHDRASLTKAKEILDTRLLPAIDTGHSKGL